MAKLQSQLSVCVCVSCGGLTSSADR